jgi:hypothetical protein
MRAPRGYSCPFLLGRKAMASLLAACRKNFPAACGLHARTKPVRLGPASLARLICALWQNNPPSFMRARCAHRHSRRCLAQQTHTGRLSGPLRIIKCTCPPPEGSRIRTGWRLNTVNPSYPRTATSRINYVTFGRGHKPAEQLKWLTFAVADLLNLPTIKREDLRVRICQPNWRMRDH